MTDEQEIVEGEVVEAPPAAVVPYSPSAGEVVDLRDRRRVANTIRSLVDWQAEVVRPLLDRLHEALVEEADHQGAYTLRYGDIEVVVDGPNAASTSWEDPKGMADELRAAGLPEERVQAVVVEERTYRVVRKEADRVAKSEKYRGIIEAHRQVNPKKRRAQVSRGR